MRRFFHDHSLSIVLVVMYLFFQSWALMVEGLRWVDQLEGHAHGAFGGLILVTMTKWTRERGSAESN